MVELNASEIIVTLGREQTGVIGTWNQRRKINIKNMVTTGENSGVIIRIGNIINIVCFIYPKALCFHYSAHRHNLILA